MGAFFLTTGAGSRRPEAERVLAAQGFERPEVVSTDAFELVVHPRHVDASACLLRFENGDFAAAAGTIVIEGRRDRDALRLAYERFTGDIRSIDDALGCFGLAIYRGGRLYVTADPVGSFALYLDDRTGTLSSSFLALAATLPRLTMRQQPIYEYVLNGSVTGDDTVVDEIRKLPLRAAYELAADRPRVRTTPPVLPTRDTRPRAAQLAEADALLDAGIRDLTTAFDGNVSLGLTDGYDSRLLFALTRRREVTPHVLLYQFAGVNAETIGIVRDLTSAEGIDLDVVNRAALPMPAPEAVPAVVAQNLLDFDGTIYHGLFTSPVDRGYRKERSPSGTVFLHGANGEIYRNPLQLPDRKYSTMDIVRAFFLKLDRRMCSARFDKRNYAHAIAEKLRRVGGLPPGKVDRQAIEWLSGAFRVRDFSGREAALSNWSGATMTPFFEGRVVRQGFRIPIPYKAGGMFEADLIRRARPRLASVRSQYGHDFASPPPLRRRALDEAAGHIPTHVRPLLYAANQRRKAREGSRAWLSPENVRAVLPEGVVRVAPLFVLDAPMEYMVRARIVSAEVLARHLDGRLQTEWGG